MEVCNHVKSDLTIIRVTGELFILLSYMLITKRLKKIKNDIGLMAIKKDYRSCLVASVVSYSRQP